MIRGPKQIALREKLGDSLDSGRKKRSSRVMNRLEVCSKKVLFFSDCSHLGLIIDAQSLQLFLRNLNVVGLTAHRLLYNVKNEQRWSELWDPMSILSQRSHPRYDPAEPLLRISRRTNLFQRAVSDAGVLTDAVNVLGSTDSSKAGATFSMRRGLWVFAKGITSSLSFDHICDALGVNAESLRRRCWNWSQCTATICVD